MENKATNQNHLSTILSAVVINRREASKPIGETDLENYCVESVWRLFNRHRSEMAKKINTSELNILLINAEILGIKIDNYRVISPIGFTGNEIEISVMMNIGNKHANVTKFSDSTDQGSVSSFILRESLKEGGIIYAEVNNNKTRLFASTKSETKLAEEVNWGKANILNKLNEAFGSSEEISEIILKRFSNGEASETLLNRANKLLTDELKDLVSKISKSCVELGGGVANKIFISFPDLSEYILNRKFIFMGKRVKMIKADNMRVREYIDDKSRVYKRFNEIIKQRIKWASIIN